MNTKKEREIIKILESRGYEVIDPFEKDVVKYINLIHSYFHGDFNKKFIGVLYNIVEVYNSSPGNENGRGTRIVP